MDSSTPTRRSTTSCSRRCLRAAGRGRGAAAQRHHHPDEHRTDAQSSEPSRFWPSRGSRGANSPMGTFLSGHAAVFFVTPPRPPRRRWGWRSSCRFRTRISVNVDEFDTLKL